MNLANLVTMEVIFERTSVRRYAVEIRRAGFPALRMDTAPGFDELFPHDLQHLVVEEQLGLRDGIYGRLARGGTAATFQPVQKSGRRDHRAHSRRRRKLARREATLSADSSGDFGRSERATIVAWHDWLAHSSDRRRRARAAELAPAAMATLDRMDDTERSTLEAALPRLRDRITVVSARWAALAVGEAMSITWSS